MKKTSHQIIRIISAVLIICVMFGLASCGKKTADVPSGVVPKNNVEENKDLVILGSYIKKSTYSYYAFTNVKNVGKDTVLNYEITYLGFDINGNPVQLGFSDEQLYRSVSFSSANIIPGGIHGLSSDDYDGCALDEAVRYIKPIVSNIKFKSGKTWSLRDLEKWSKKTIADFSVDNEKKVDTSIKEDAQKALENPYISFTSTHFQEDDYLDSKDLFCTIKNNSEKSILSFWMIVVEFDNEGKAVTMKNQSWAWEYSYISGNSKYLGAEIGIEPGQEQDIFWENALVSTCSDYLIIADRIEFDDDTVWQNEYSLQFMKYYDEGKPNT